MAPNLTKNSTDILTPVADDHHHQKPTHQLLSLKHRHLLASGHPFLLDVPPNVTVTPTSKEGSFIGFTSQTPRSRHVTPIGKLRNIRFASIFRFKVWWTTHWTGINGRDVERETQFLMLDKDDSVGRPYVVLLPIVEAAFRASLQAGESSADHDEDYVEVCVESGSSEVKERRFGAVVYVHVGDDPFAVVKEAVRAVREHLGTFRLLEEKNPPPIVDKFGWCTWDAFYLKVII